MAVLLAPGEEEEAARAHLREAGAWAELKPGPVAYLSLRPPWVQGAMREWKVIKSHLGQLWQHLLGGGVLLDAVCLGPNTHCPLRSQSLLGDRPLCPSSWDGENEDAAGNQFRVSPNRIKASWSSLPDAGPAPAPAPGEQFRPKAAV